MLKNVDTVHLRRFLRYALRAGMVVIFCLLYVLFVGIEFNASPLRETITNVFSNSVGRNVRFDGPLQLEISARPKLRVGGVHIANLSDFAGSEFASLGEARLSLNLWPLFRGQLQIEELSGSNVHIRLQHRDNGSNNWAFQLSKPRQEGMRATEEGAPASSNDLGHMLTVLDIKRVTLENLGIEYIGDNTKSHFFDLHSLTAQLPTGKPLTLALNGTVEKTFPYKLDFTGGAIEDFARTDKPWPIDLKLALLSTRLYLNGSVSGAGGEINFGLGTENLLDFERLFQAKLPDVGVVGIAGALTYGAGKMELNHLDGVMGKTTFNGMLGLDYAGVRPRITGSLKVPTLDLRPFLEGKPGEKTEPPQSIAELYRELSKATFSLKELNSADSDVALRVGSWLNLPGNVHDAMLQVKINKGHLDVPIQATVAGVTISGLAGADATTTPARFKLGLGTHDSNLGGLAELLVGVKGIKGEMGRFDLRIAAEGDRGNELMKSLDVRLNVERGKLTYGNNEGERPVAFSLEKFAVVLPPGKPLQGEARGFLLDQPFAALLHGSALEPMMLEARAPIDFSIRSGSVHAHIFGVLQPLDEKFGPEITFELSAPRSGDVASWFGFKSGTDAAILLKGKASMNSREWQLADFSFQLGRSSLSADMVCTEIEGKPLLKMRLSGERVDVGELELLLPQSNQSASSGSVLDIPILPKGIDLADADIEVLVKRFVGSSAFEVSDLSFDGRIREGVMHASPFALNVAGASFSGAISLDLRSMQPRTTMWLAADSLDVGSMLKKLNLSRDTEAGIRKLGLYLDLHSSRLGDLISHSALMTNFEGGHLTLRDSNTGGQMRIILDRGVLKMDAGGVVSLDLNGALDGIPVSIGIETAPAASLVNPLLRIPVRLTVEAANTTMKLSGSIARPLTQADIELALDMHGARFDNLNSLVRASLPPWGPWSAAGKFRMSAQGYEVADLMLGVGDSALAGQGKLDTTTVRPRLDVTLKAPNIQLDDFKFADWSPVKENPDAKLLSKTRRPLTSDEIRKKAAESSTQAQQLLSPEVLQRQDAYLTVRVDKVLSGKDTLGSGKLIAKLESGRFDIDPIEVNMPGGSARLWFGYKPNDNDVQVDLRAKVKRFDYGVLARRIKPDTDLRGNFSLDVDVSSRARYLSEILRYGNGRIDFTIRPENMKSGVFDIWAVNLLVALLPAVDSSKASKVNCAIGRFALKDGKLNDEIVLIDTSRMRVVCKGSADFADEKIMLHMQPKAKKPQFLSLATPINVSGNFDNFNVSVEASEIIGTIGRFGTSLVWVPIQMLFGKDIPADGSDVCAEVGLSEP